jgi:hypothetical protein
VRWSLLLLLVAIPAVALARPRLAVAPLDGDAGGKIAELVATSAADHGRVTPPSRVEKVMASTRVGKLDAKGAAKVRGKLGADVLIHGRVERTGGKRRLALTLSGKGRTRFEVEYRTLRDLETALGPRLGKRIDAANRGVAMRDEVAEPEPRKKPRDDDARTKRRAARDDDETRTKRRAARDDDETRTRRRAARDDDETRTKRRAPRDAARDEDERTRTRRRVARDDDDGSTRTRKRARDDDDDDGDDRRRKRKRNRRDRDDDMEPRAPVAVTQAAIWLDAGAQVARRTLTYEVNGNMPPPPVGTAAPAGRITAELYPGALLGKEGPAAAVGLAVDATRAVGLGIAVPNTNVTAPIETGHHAIGVRYRLLFGGASVAVGASYWRRYYVADRADLAMASELDMPDVSYTAIAPGVVARIPATPAVGLFISFDLPLMLSSGPIQSVDSYGSSTIFAFGLRAGARIALGTHYAVQIVAELDQVGLTFTGQPGSQSDTRGVASATDRTVGVAATLGIQY